MEDVTGVEYWINHLEEKPKLMVRVNTVEDSGIHAGTVIQYEGEVCELIILDRFEQEGKG